MHSIEIYWGAVPQQMRRTAAYFESVCIYVSSNSENNYVINGS
jgi:hypothetical protein